MTYTIAVRTVKIAYDEQRNCPKHLEFYSKNKFYELVNLVGFIIRIYHDARSTERQICLCNFFYVVRMFTDLVSFWESGNLNQASSCYFASVLCEVTDTFLATQAWRGAECKQLWQERKLRFSGKQENSVRVCDFQRNTYVY